MARKGVGERKFGSYDRCKLPSRPDMLRLGEAKAAAVTA